MDVPQRCGCPRSAASAAAGRSASCAQARAGAAAHQPRRGRGQWRAWIPVAPGRACPHPAQGGLEPAVPVCGDEPAGQALSRLRQAGASLVVTLDAEGRPQTVVPEKTLAAARAGQQVATCQLAWPAATFIQPASAEDARRLAAHNQNQPFRGAPDRGSGKRPDRRSGAGPGPDRPARAYFPGAGTTALGNRFAHHADAVRAQVPYPPAAPAATAKPLPMTASTAGRCRGAAAKPGEKCRERQHHYGLPEI